ncbi:hypothetical protein OEZ86_009612 [Tetradesmus obliquus]|uniref:Uncharacterized protein n=1 Tax=Tetradesmus obliquus TaxID=3088 RepID=A0ABY8UM59_TETOB|nr:hypothetical protein OEZ85_001056 [Tetradesmus obliquus]WIA43087.1 hypothetical protein OEZ86_009612 [Tetradesmus obliquus]
MTHQHHLARYCHPHHHPHHHQSRPNQALRHHLAQVVSTAAWIGRMTLPADAAHGRSLWELAMYVCCSTMGASSVLDHMTQASLVVVVEIGTTTRCLHLPRSLLASPSAV